MKRIIIFTLLSCVTLWAMAENRKYQLVILAKDGSKATYDLRLKPKITFDESNLVVTVNKIPTAYPMNQTVHFFYETAPDINGDANDDGSVDIADAVCVVNHVVGKDTPAFNINAADANGDGEVDIADAVHIVNYVVGKIDQLAPQRDMEQTDPE